MKIALVHDYIKEYGGAERVLEALHELYPKAPVFTSVYLPQFLGPHRERFENWDINTSWLQYIPFKGKFISPLRLIASFVFKQFDFSGYDVIISSATGAYFPNSIDKKKAKLICYCHTPPRYLYGYATAREWKKNPLINALGEIANHFLRMVDFNASKNVDIYIANSEEVAARIQKFYRREATVIYPPVDINPKSEARNPKQIQNTKYKIPNTSYYLAGGRLARPKHMDLIIKACLELHVPLKVFGKGFAGYGEELKKISNAKYPMPNIQFMGEVSDEEKQELMANAKAFLFASEDEDFGIIPVEAMTVGLPVIAYRSGGVKETVIDGKTGLFFDELTVESLIKVIRQFEKMKFDPSDATKQAEKFSKEQFIKKIQEFLKKYA
jgi:glycosyltransferase involved in cell wall biosynthesis